MLVFCDNFLRKCNTANRHQPIQTQTIYLQDRTYLVHKVSDRLIIFFALKHIRQFTNYDGISQVYYQNMITNFMEHFDLWFGVKQEWIGVFFKLWVKINSKGTDYINLSEFSFRNIQYASLNQSQTLVIQYLSSILRNIDQTLLHTAIFYKGLFVQSNLPLGKVLLIKEAFIGSDIFQTQIENFKQFNPVSMAFNLDNSVMMGQAYNYYQNLNVLVEKDDLITCQKLFLNQKSRCLFTHELNNLVFFLIFSVPPQLGLLNEIVVALRRNNHKITEKIHHLQQIQLESLAQDEIKFILFNHNNMLLKFSNNMPYISRKYFNLISQMKLRLEGLMGVRQEMRKLGSFYVYGIKAVERTLFLLIPHTVPSEKLESEIDQIIKTRFNNMFI